MMHEYEYFITFPPDYIYCTRTVRYDDGAAIRRTVLVLVLVRVLGVELVRVLYSDSTSTVYLYE